MKVKDLEYHREHWAKVAKKNDWYTEPFYVEENEEEYA